MILQRRDAEHRGQARRADTHRGFQRQFFGQWQQPIRLHAGELRKAAPIFLARAPTREHDRVARFEPARLRFRHKAGEIDARYHRESAHDLAAIRDGERVLVVQTRIRDRNENVALGQGTHGKLLDVGVDAPADIVQHQGPEWIWMRHATSRVAGRPRPEKFFPFVCAPPWRKVAV